MNHGVHIIEEIRLFPAGQPVLQLLLDQDQAGTALGSTGAGAMRGTLWAQPAWGRSRSWAGLCRSRRHCRAPGLGTPLTPLCTIPQGLVYAATYTAVAQVPFANCSLYRSCGECVLARDPFCAWSRGACRRTTLHPLAHPQ